MAITARFIREQGKILQGYRHDLKRARAIAREVERLNKSVSAAAGKIEFEDEPSRYRVIVERGSTRRARMKR